MRVLSLIPALVVSLVWSALAIETAQADRRVAFVVGNGAYKNVAQLPNPPVDAGAMAVTLRNVGFDVVEGTNLNREQMTEKLLEFGRRSQGADVAVFYYAGHGIAISGTNYLLPIDADIKSEMDAKLGAAINVDVTLEQTLADAKVKLVFLDACRDNPFAAKIRSTASTRSVSVQTGLAEMKSGEGTLIAFATGPGQTALDGEAGTNSPFTRALIAHITKPGVEIQQAMTQVRAQVNEETAKGQLPWGHTNLIGAVYLNPADGGAAAAAAPAIVAAVQPANDIELEFWRSVKDSNKAEELKAYLTNYPNGQFRSLALARVASLDNGPSTTTRNLTTGVDPATFTEQGTQVTEDQIGLDKSLRRDVQRRLTGLGFDIKASGKFDEPTRAVLKRWQAARGYPSSGYLTKLQHKALLAEIVPAAVTANANEERPARRAQRSSGGGGGYHRSGPDAGAAFIGGVMGGMLGGAFRR
ncbi:caspase family protein [Bradyrhizobium sp. SRS-191]|uniref:caspase family protein n=1 Tax=Bradyrhizobium sp. SRS-191 TaxID=2962606 RepID=UPI00211F27A0|nr:caspase family protein [Bradyrhizobium sp. SRS-191]